MTEIDKRPWFRFHLSTAVIAMFVAGGMLGLNFIVYRGVIATTYEETDGSYSKVTYFHEAPIKVTAIVQGWPFYHSVDFSTLMLNGKPCAIKDAPIFKMNICFSILHRDVGWILTVIMDIFVTLSVMFLLEWWIRKHPTPEEQRMLKKAAKDNKPTP